MILGPGVYKLGNTTMIYIYLDIHFFYYCYDYRGEDIYYNNTKAFASLRHNTVGDQC